MRFFFPRNRPLSTAASGQYTTKTNMPYFALNLVSIGDSEHERKALHSVASSHKGDAVKTIKFVDLPDVEQLVQQWEVVMRPEHLKRIFVESASYDEDLRT